MTFGDYWYMKQRKNTALVNAEKVTLSVESFRRELEKAFLAGKLEGQVEGKPYVPNVFDSIFGKH